MNTPSLGSITFYTHPMSRGRIARWMLEETGRPYETEVMDYGAPLQSAAFRALNPMGKVPTLVHGAVVVTEAAAICTYLADAFPEAGLAPAPSSPERGAFYRWMFFAAGPLEQAVTDNAMGLRPEDPMQQSRMGYGSLPRVLDTLEGLLGDGRTHVLGTGFSAVDVYLGSALGWGMFTGGIEARPAFTAYVGRLRDRPAARRASAADDALIPRPPAG